MLSQEDIAQIMAVTDTKYVQKDVCNDRHEKGEKELVEIQVQLAKMNTMLSIQTKVTAFIATGIGTLLVGAIGKLIIK